MSFSRFKVPRSTLLIIILLLLLPACNAINPLCGSARPAPVLTSITPATMVFAQMPASFVITATGTGFVASSVVNFNGVTLVPDVVSSTEITVTITSAMITATGNYNFAIQTPAGNSGDLGCSSGGTSTPQVLTVD